MCLLQSSLSRLLDPAVIASIILAIITFFYMRQTRRIAAATSREFELRTKLQVNIFFERSYISDDYQYDFTCKIENKGYYSVKILQSQIRVYYLKNSERLEFYSAAVGYSVFINAGESFQIVDVHKFDGLQQLITQDEKDNPVEIDATFSFLDCLGKKVEEPRTYKIKLG